MVKSLKGKDLYSSDIERSVCVEIPHICPRCNHGADFLVKDVYVYKKIDHYADGVAYITYLCPVCEKVFIGEYKGEVDLSDTPLQEIEVLPHTFDSSERVFTEDIKELSQDFVNVYNQSLKAEKMGLSEICGMGYRKALEFLVKEYAILMNEDYKEKISEMYLGNCIEEYFKENEKLYVLAKASTWLGNDETHYKRKHESYGIDEMKSFIDIMVSYIDSELKYIKAKRLVDRE